MNCLGLLVLTRILHRCILYLYNFKTEIDFYIHNEYQYIFSWHKIWIYKYTYTFTNGAKWWTMPRLRNIYPWFIHFPIFIFFFSSFYSFPFFLLLFFPPRFFVLFLVSFSWNFRKKRLETCANVGRVLFIFERQTKSVHAGFYTSVLFHFRLGSIADNIRWQHSSEIVFYTGGIIFPTNRIA